MPDVPSIVLLHRAMSIVRRGWTRHWWARDEDGHDVPPDDPSAVAWSAVGALDRAAHELGYPDDDLAYSRLINVAAKSQVEAPVTEKPQPTQEPTARRKTTAERLTEARELIEGGFVAIQRGFDVMVQVAVKRPGDDPIRLRAEDARENLLPRMYADIRYIASDLLDLMRVETLEQRIRELEAQLAEHAPKSKPRNGGGQKAAAQPESKGGKVSPKAGSKPAAVKTAA